MTRENVIIFAKARENSKNLYSCCFPGTSANVDYVNLWEETRYSSVLPSIQHVEGTPFRRNKPVFQSANFG